MMFLVVSATRKDLVLNKVWKYVGVCCVVELMLVFCLKL